MDVSATARKAFQFILQDRRMRGLWKWADLLIALGAIGILVRPLWLHFGFLFQEAFDLSLKSLRLPFVLSGLGIVALIIALAIKWYSQDGQAVKAHYRKNLLESQIPAAGALAIFFPL